jgi:hypothetical protein
MPEDMEDHDAELSDAMSENEDDSETYSKSHDKMADHSSTSPNTGDAPVKKKYDPKDPSRPRRKKARRACYACQRAHLTCGKSYRTWHSLEILRSHLCPPYVEHPLIGISVQEMSGLANDVSSVALVTPVKTVCERRPSTSMMHLQRLSDQSSDPITTPTSTHPVPRHTGKVRQTRETQCPQMPAATSFLKAVVPLSPSTRAHHSRQ